MANTGETHIPFKCTMMNNLCVIICQVNLKNGHVIPDKILLYHENEIVNFLCGKCVTMFSTAGWVELGRIQLNTLN